MYASQTKRLCVREASSDETRTQHHSNSSSEARPDSVAQQHQSSTSVASITSNAQAKSSESDYILQPSTANPSAVKRACSNCSPVGGVSTASGLEPNGPRLGQLEKISLNMTASATESATTCAGSSSQSSPSKANTSGPVLQADREFALKENKHDFVTNNLRHSYNYSEHELIDRLMKATSDEAKLEMILAIRYLITACNKRKDSVVNDVNFSEIFKFIDTNDESSYVVKAQTALLLCSIAKGGETNVKILNDSCVAEKIYDLLLSTKDDALIEACLRCLRAIMSWPQVSPKSLLYDTASKKNRSSNQTQENNKILEENTGLKQIIELARTTKSFIVQECSSDILALTCCRDKDQILLFNHGALSCISQLVESDSNRVIVSSLNWLTSLCLKNRLVSLAASKTNCPTGTALLDRLIELMSKDECCELQFLAAKCFTQIYRALPAEQMGRETRISFHVLPTLVRMAQKDKPSKLRAEAAECIAYLIEYDKKLQETASICDHLIKSLASMLDQDISTPKTAKYREFRDHVQQTQHFYMIAVTRDLALSLQRPDTSSHPLESRSSAQIDQAEKSKLLAESNGTCNSTTGYSKEMKRAAFLALAALASNQEPIRKKIFETCAIMQHLIKGLSDNDPKTLKSVLTCLLSLSRSVQQLRTSFAENSVYSALKGLLNTQSNDILILVLAVLCNISLDFSTGKQQFLDSSTINILCSLTKGSDPFLRLHAMWILMNMVYQLKDQNLKFQIFRSLGADHVLNILETETYEELVLKTLGFLRNLLSQKSHIDAIMSSHGEQIMQSLIRVFERPSSSRVKEQALCVLTNIADGSDAKRLIMGNRVVLSFLARTLCNDQAGDTRLAAICCITNLAHREQDGSYERRDEMRKFGIEDQLKSMLNIDDPILSDRARTAYNQFCQGIDDNG